MTRRASKHRLLNCRSGATAVEFAFVLPVLLLLIMGIIEFSLIMFVQSVMEGATTDTARLGRTGYVDAAAGIPRDQEIINNIVSRAAGLINPQSIIVDEQVYPNFSSVNQPEPCLTALCGGGVAGVDYTDVNGNGKWDQDMGVAGLGNANDVVVYTAHYSWTILTPLMRAIIGPSFPITARTVVKNEPF